MGPLSGAAPTTLSARHGKCREKEKCTGPGCKLRTGKTESKNKNQKG